MKIWLDDYSQLIEESSQLHVPVEHTTVRSVILSSLKGDPRYKDVLRELHNHKEWPMTVIRKHLFAAAQLVDDLVEDATKLPKKKAHVTKDTEVSAESLAEAHKLIAKAKMQKAHPNGKKGGKADAEGDGEGHLEGGGEWQSEGGGGLAEGGGKAKHIEGPHMDE